MRGNITKVVGQAVKNGRRGRGVAAVVGLMACSALVWQSSHATFTSTTSNDANIFGTGSVVLTDVDSGTKMFNLPALAPGDTGEACIGVTYTGTLTPSGIHVYFPHASATEKDNGGTASAWGTDANAQMDDNLEIVITASAPKTGTPDMNCAGAYPNLLTAAAPPADTLKSLITANYDFATGLVSPAIAKDEWRSYKIAYTFKSTAPNAAQNDGIQFNINWEAQK